MKTKMSGDHFKPCPEISGRAIGVGVTPLCARSVKSKFLSVLALALACAAGPLASSGAAAGVTILNGVNPGSSTAQAHALNNAGVVVGESTTSNPGRARFAATWTDGALSMLPGLPGAPAVGDRPLGSTQGDAAFGINKHGVSVGLAQWPVPGGNFNARAVRWTHGVPTELAALPGSTLSGAQSINNDGEMAGFSGDGIDFQAVRWSSAGAIQTLDLLPTHTTSYASDINASGRVVGYSGLESDGTVEERLPVFWDGTRVSNLPLPPGFNQGQAVGLHKNDIIVGQAAAYDANIGGNTGVRAVLWAELRFQPDLLALLPGSSASTAGKVNQSA